MTIYDVFPSPIGDITASANGGAITGVHIEGDRYFSGVPEGWVRKSDDPLLRQLRNELDEYFAGERTAFTVPVAFAGTEFQLSVWHALQELSAKETTSYGTLATSIGKPKAARAVGTAVGRNPLCIVVPCHRVLASDGSLGGYVAGMDRKLHLLTLEGAIAA